MCILPAAVAIVNESGTNTPIEVPEVFMSFFDLDQSFEGKMLEPIGVAACRGAWRSGSFSHFFSFSFHIYIYILRVQD